MNAPAPITYKVRTTKFDSARPFEVYIAQLGYMRPVKGRYATLAQAKRRAAQLNSDTE